MSVTVCLHVTNPYKEYAKSILLLLYTKYSKYAGKDDKVLKVCRKYNFVRIIQCYWRTAVGEVRIYEIKCSTPPKAEDTRPKAQHLS
jgi:hypothetical protein